MNEEDHQPNQVAFIASEPEKDRVLAGLKLPSDIQAIAWSSGAAVFTWLAGCIGEAYEAGTRSALGLDALSPAAADQIHIFGGFLIILQCAIDVIIAFVVLRLIWLLGRWALRKISYRLKPVVPEWLTRNLWLFVLILVLADAAFFFGSMGDLADKARGILLKSTSEVGGIWTEVIFDTDHSTVVVLDSLYGLGLTLFIALNWWLISRGLTRPWAKVALSLYAAGGVLTFIFFSAYLHGIAGTVREFPVVAYSGISETDRGYIPFLIGQDDKLFALLVVKMDDKLDVVQQRNVVYLPRTEVKWMTVVRYLPLYRVADLNDLKRADEEIRNSSQ
jgi:hypothetical protein